MNLLRTLSNGLRNKPKRERMKPENILKMLKNGLKTKQRTFQAEISWLKRLAMPNNGQKTNQRTSLIEKKLNKKLRVPWNKSKIKPRKLPTEAMWTIMLKDLKKEITKD